MVKAPDEDTDPAVPRPNPTPAHGLGKVVMGVRIPDLPPEMESKYPRMDSDQDEDERFTVSRLEVPEELRHLRSPDSLPPSAGVHEHNLAWVKWAAKATAATAKSLERFVKDQERKHEKSDQIQDGLQTAVAGLQVVVGQLQATIANGGTKLTVGAILVAAVAAGVPKGCELVGPRLLPPPAHAAPTPSK